MTTTSVLDQLGNREVVALRDYRAILSDVAGAAEPGDAERLEQIMAALSLSADDVRADAAGMREARRIEVVVAELPELDRRRINHALGNALATIRARPFADDGLRVERVGQDGHAKVARWRVVTGWEDKS